ncbi:MAG: DUF2909 domain-containing protein [Rubrivivax sp.]|nr:DUF2909 domain-containing protein [Rubrivivax sp.]
MKFVIVIALLGIVGALAGAGTFMLRRRPHLPEPGAEPDRKMARALALRVALSVAIFLLVLLSWWFGWVRPGGLPVGR